MIIIKSFFVFLVLGCIWLIGFDRFFAAGDAIDAELKAAYRHATGYQPKQRQCVTRTQLPKRTTRRDAPDGC